MPGEWTLRLSAPEDQYKIYYWIDGAVSYGMTTYAATVESAAGKTIDYPEQILLNAYVGMEFMITGLTAEGTIEAPSGIVRNFTLRDDGNPPDAVASDGFYAALVDYDMNGVHYITVTFDNSAQTAEFTEFGSYFAEPPGETGPKTLETTPVEENFQRFDQIRVTVTGVAPDDHADWYDEGPTPLPTDNTPVAGRINHANDDDTFQVTVPDDWSGDLVVRVSDLTDGMDPYLYIFAEDFSWTLENWFKEVPGADDVLTTTISVTPGETFFIEVWQFEVDADTGGYHISAGKPITGEQTPAFREKAGPPADDDEDDDGDGCFIDSSAASRRQPAATLLFYAVLAVGVLFFQRRRE
jgi:hypothetical protein